MQTTKNIKKGSLLIAEPSILDDKEFNRTVILITEHNLDGTVGFILNNSTNHYIKDLIPEIDSNHKVYIGGPVSKENLYFIHNVPDLITNSVQIDNNIFWGGDFETIKGLLNNQILKPNQIRFFLGYSGWSKEQLTDEIKQSSWIITKNKFDNILSVDSNSFWKEELLKIGGEYQIWANAPKNPNLN